MGKRKIVEFKQNIVLLNFTIVFRTTPVFVYPISGTLKENFKLQYNSCYCLSILPGLRRTEIFSISIQLLLLFIILGRNTAPQLLFYFNTTLVIVYLEI